MCPSLLCGSASAECSKVNLLRGPVLVVLLPRLLDLRCVENRELLRRVRSFRHFREDLGTHGQRVRSRLQSISRYCTMTATSPTVPLLRRRKGKGRVRTSMHRAVMLIIDKYRRCTYVVYFRSCVYCMQFSEVLERERRGCNCQTHVNGASVPSPSGR